MAVLVEAISIIIKLQSIEEHGGFTRFEKLLNSSTFCSDGFLARIGFMDPRDIEKSCSALDKEGLLHQVNNTAHDFVVVDQQTGCTTPCDWVQVGRVDPGFGSIVCCKHVSDDSTQVFTPDAWTYSGSLSESFGFVPEGTEQTGLKFLRQENGLDVYLNELTGKEVYVGRRS